MIVYTTVIVTLSVIGLFLGGGDFTKFFAQLLALLLWLPIVGRIFGWW